MTWWTETETDYPQLEELVIDLEGGPSNRSDRTQFIKRMVEFSKSTGLRIRLIYYPPYPSKYNPIGRCWGVLENYWNGAILDSVETVVQWVSNITWKGIKPIVHRVETVYEKAIKVSPKELEPYTPCWKRSESLPKWDITIVSGWLVFCFSASP